MSACDTNIRSDKAKKLNNSTCKHANELLKTGLCINKWIKGISKMKDAIIMYF